MTCDIATLYCPCCNLARQRAHTPDPPSRLTEQTLADGRSVDPSLSRANLYSLSRLV
jgi:hypothetical protein